MTTPSTTPTTPTTVAATDRIDPLLVPQVHEVLETRAEIPGVVTLRVAPIGEPPRPFLPAQIGMVGAFGVGEAAISISSAITDHAAHEYTIRRAGAITTALTRLHPGDQLWVRGPFGAPWDLDLDGRDVMIAAGGLGIAPLRSAVYEILRHRDRLRRGRRRDRRAQPGAPPLRRRVRGVAVGRDPCRGDDRPRRRQLGRPRGLRARRPRHRQR
jgi:hypothetical protein